MRLKPFSRRRAHSRSAASTWCWWVGPVRRTGRACNCWIRSRRRNWANGCAERGSSSPTADPRCCKPSPAAKRAWRYPLRAIRPSVSAAASVPGLPLQRRLPKRGFHNIFRVQMAVVNLNQLESLAGGEITPENLAQHGLIGGKNRRVKILGEGSLSKALTVRAHGFSATAKQKIEAAGGKAELITLHA